MTYCNTILFVLCLLASSAHGQVSKWAMSGDVMIHFQTIGEGDPVLIINGGPGFSSEGFIPLARKIAALGYTAIVYDQRGTGKSRMSLQDSTTITMDLMNKDIEAIRRKLNIHEWIVFGHSFGGMMANYYASHCPQHVKAMIQSSSGGIDLSLIQNASASLYSKLTNDEADSLDYWRMQYAESGSVSHRKKYTKYLANAYVYDKKHVPAVAKRLMQGNLYLNSLVWQNMRQINYDCKVQLENFNKPVLIIHGEDDIVPLQVAHDAHKVYPQSKLVVLERSRHYGWLDREEAYLEEIKQFLGSLD